MAEGDPKSAADLAAELIGASGVVYSGNPRSAAGAMSWGLAVAEEWSQDLRGQKAAKMYRELRDNEAMVNAAISAMILFASRARWSVQTATPTGEAEAARAADAATFLQECMNDLGRPWKLGRPSWRDVLTGILSCVQYGFSICEVTFKRRNGVDSDYNDGRYGWNRIMNLGQQSLNGWLFDADGDVDGVEQIPPNGGWIVKIRGARRLLLVKAPGAHNPENPEGRSVLRSCVVPYLYKKGLQKIQAMGAQRNLVGLPVFEVPLDYLSPTAPAAQQALVTKIKQIGENLDADRLRFLVFPASKGKDGQPTGFSFSLQSGGQQRPMDLEPSISRYSREMLAGLLADWLLLGSAAGSYALSDSKTGMWAASLEGLLDIVAEALNRQLIPHLMEINGIPRPLWPELRHGGISQDDQKGLMQVVGELLKAGGITPDEVLEQSLRARAGLPQKPHPEADGAAPQDGGEV